MKTITMIGIAAALCLPALAVAQRGGGGGAVGVQRVDVQRVEVQRLDTGRTITPSRDIEIARGGVVETGTRLRRPDPDRRRLHNPRRRWNAAHPPGPDPARRRWNAANPSGPDRSRRRAGR